MKHPAKYSESLMPILEKCIRGRESILDPFSGTGKILEIAPTATMLEIEPEWARLSGAIVGDATDMPFKNCTFDAVCTSPTYGNRMADHFVDRQPGKKYQRHTYRHYLGRSLHAHNSGRMQWGKKYRALHWAAWAECTRVLMSGGILVLNISNHIRAGAEVDVCGWHESIIIGFGFQKIDEIRVETKRQRHGANRGARVEFEKVIVFEKENN